MGFVYPRRLIHLNILFLGDILSGQPGALLWSPPSRIPLPLLTEVPRALSPWRTQDGYKQVPSLQVEVRTIQECPPEPRPTSALGTCCLKISKKGVISAPFCSQGASPWPECRPSLAAPAASTYMGPGSSMNLWQGVSAIPRAKTSFCCSSHSYLRAGGQALF